MAANTYGRQVVIPLTNKSGGGVIAGDVVVVDTGNNDAFTTTTSAGFTGGVGIAQETIANNAVGRVLISGYVALVNVNASVTRGNFGKTHTVAKQATDAGSTRGTGTFCQFLTGGTTPDALMYPVDLLGSSLTNPMTTKGDIIQGDTGGTPVRLAAGTSGYVLTAGGAGAFSAWAAPAAGSLVLLEQHTASASATLDFTSFISGTYDEYRFELINLAPATDSVSFLVRAGTGGGPTYDSGANYDSAGWYVYAASSGITAGSANGGTSISLLTAAGNAGQYGISGHLRLINPASASLYKALVGDVAYEHASVGLLRVMASGVYKSATAMTAVRFLMSSGNITSGTIRVYGIAKT